MTDTDMQALEEALYPNCNEALTSTKYLSVIVSRRWYESLPKRIERFGRAISVNAIEQWCGDEGSPGSCDHDKAMNAGIESLRSGGDE